MIEVEVEELIAHTKAARAALRRDGAEKGDATDAG